MLPYPGRTGSVPESDSSWKQLIRTGAQKVSTKKTLPGSIGNGNSPPNSNGTYTDSVPQNSYNLATCHNVINIDVSYQMWY